MLTFCVLLWYNYITKGGENYEKNLFRHNQELILENEKLKAKAGKIEAETANKYLGIIDRLNEALETVMKKCNELEERVTKLEGENDRLRKQLNNDSSNSSNPPSTDIKPNAPNTYNGRTKTGRKSGGQKGHAGKCLSRAAIEDKIAKGQKAKRLLWLMEFCRSLSVRWFTTTTQSIIITEQTMRNAMFISSDICGQIRRIHIIAGLTR